MPLIGAATAPAVHVMSWNVRRPVPHLRRSHPDAWPRRAPRLRSLLAAEVPTVLGAQEVTPVQAQAIRDALGPGYRSVGRGRNADGGGEACPVVWDDRRLELVGWQQVALSPTPDRAGSRGYGNPWPRIAVVADFCDRVTAGAFTVVNTHLDPLSARSRHRSARQLVALVAGSRSPVVLTGDFNERAGRATHRVLVEEAELVDPFASGTGSPTSTFGGYRAPRTNGPRLDWVLVSPRIRVARAVTNTARVQGGWPSDHLPVQVLIDPSIPDAAQVRASGSEASS